MNYEFFLVVVWNELHSRDKRLLKMVYLLKNFNSRKNNEVCENVDVGQLITNVKVFR